jgi:hypothetical protein
MSNPARSAPRRLLVATCVALACTGCASPYVTVSDTAVAARRAEPMDLAGALGMERAYHDAYREKVIALGDNERYLSNGLITLGAVLAGLSAGHASAGTVAGVAIAGGTGYSLGVFNTDKRRAQIYVAGMKALECADEAVLPYHLSASTLKDIDERMAALQSEAAAVTSLADDLRRQRETAKAGPAFAAAGTALDAATRSASGAGQARAGARQLLRQRDQMGERLRNTVVKIDKAVVDEIRGTEGSIQSVPALLAGLNANIGAFSALGAARAASPASAGQDSGRPLHAAGTPDALDTATAVLTDRVAALDAKAQQLADLVAAINQDARAAASLSDCRVDGPPTTMTITPAALTFIAGTTNRQVLLPAGGKPGYTAAFVQADHPGLGIDDIAPGADEIYVSELASPAATAGAYQILVKDASGQKQIVAVTVGGAAGPAAAAPQKAATSTADADALAVKALALTVQGLPVTLTHVEHRPDGSWGIGYAVPAGSAVASGDVEAGLAALPGFVSIAGTGARVHAVAMAAGADSGRTIAAKTAARAAAYGPVAGGLALADAKAIQRALCLPDDRVDGLWGRRTQAALLDDRARRGAAGEKGQPPGPLAPDEARALAARTPEQVAAACKR